MKVLFDCHTPFMLAHGGLQVQIDQTQLALEKLGVAVEPLRWWDAAQFGDLLQHFGKVPNTTVDLAHRKGMHVVVSDLLTEQGSRSRLRLATQRGLSLLIKKFVPRTFTRSFHWESYRSADAFLALTPWEAHLMSYLFGAPAPKVHVVPNGVEEAFLNSQPAERGQWLICTATITERKGVLPLAQAAVEARTPLWIIGKSYDESDPYAQQFLEFARNNSQFVRYEGAMSERAALARAYRAARGFVLLSTMESLSLSTLEAAACECPLLLSDLPWARWTFQQRASYCRVGKSISFIAAALRAFYDQAPVLEKPSKPLSWREVAAQLKDLYERLLRGSMGVP